MTNKETIDKFFLDNEKDKFDTIKMFVDLYNRSEYKKQPDINISSMNYINNCGKDKVQKLEFLKYYFKNIEHKYKGDY